jgi:ribosomal protein S18 acetylase RimI-like enzyme
MGDVRIQPLSPRQARQAADLHHDQIASGFLSRLGRAFLRQLYAAIPSCPAGFGYVWQEADGRVSGFIACATSTGRLYRQALWRRGALMAVVLARFLVRPAVLHQMWQTLRYPKEAEKDPSGASADLPPAEVLSIAVAPGAQGRGVGKALMAAALEEFRRRGVGRVKVAVGAANQTANAFYRRCGFALRLVRQHHGQPMNVYVADLPAPAAAEGGSGIRASPDARSPHQVVSGE